MFSTTAFSAKVLEVDGQKNLYDLESYLEILEDKNDDFSLERVQIKQFESATDFKKPKYPVDAYWAKLSIKNTTPKSAMLQDWILGFSPYNYDITVFVPTDESDKMYNKLRVGNGVPYKERSYHPIGKMSRTNVRISLPHQKTTEIYIKYYDNRPKRYPHLAVGLFTIEKYGEKVLLNSLFTTFLVGGLLMMLLIVVILNWYSWKIEYYYYILYLGCLVICELFFLGIDDIFLSSNLGIISYWAEPTIFANIPLHRTLVNIVYYIIYITYLLFIREFLALSKTMPDWNKAFNVLMLVGLAAMVGTQIQLVMADYDRSEARVISGLFVIIVYIFLFVFMISLLRTKIKRKNLIVAGIGITILGGLPVILLVIANKDTPFTYYGPSILFFAFFLEKIIFTFALSFRQRDVEMKLLKNEEKQKLVLQAQNEKLELAVADRTADLTTKQSQLKAQKGALEETVSKLTETQTELENSFSTLQSAQTKLVASEKMASLGVLTAGIAHEINNPINFVANGIDNIEYNFIDLIEAVEKYRKLNPSTNIEEQLAQIEEFNQTIELDELIDDSKNMFKSIRNGVTRTVSIVKSLKNFSRLDEEAFKEADVHEGIESTLEILTNKLKNRVEIIKNYSNIPPIPCNPGRLNQVFMNLIGNAAQAIKDRGKITITTQVIDNGDTLKIEFEDTGSGMKKETVGRIFEPFFTTKEVGKGTGLGLSISYGIIKDHNGDINVESELGKGTKFTILLPYNAQKTNNE